MQAASSRGSVLPVGPSPPEASGVEPAAVARPLPADGIFHTAALSDSPAVLLNRRLSTVLPGAKVDSEPPSWEDHG